MLHPIADTVWKMPTPPPDFIAAHPGTTDQDMLNLALWLKRNKFRLDQVQTFLPTPMALATAMYHTELNPLKKVLRGAQPVAVTKAMDSARRNMIKVSLKNGSIHHKVVGEHGASHVLMAPAPAGTGIIAGGPMRAVFESLGVADVVTKSVGTSNPYNMIRATFEALTSQVSPKSVAQRRGKKIADLLGRGGSETAEADAAAVVE